VSISLSDMASGAKPVSVFRHLHSRLENTTQAYRRQLKYSTGIVKEKKKTAIVVGTGAGGTMMAKELQGTYQVTILEIRQDRVSSVRGWYRGRKYRFHADLVVLAAGGLGTPPIITIMALAKKIADKLNTSS